MLVGPAGLGVPGAAVATVAAQGLSALLALALVRRRFAAGRVLGSGVLAAGLGAHVRAVLSVGLPSAVQMAVVDVYKRQVRSACQLAAACSTPSAR